MNRTHLRILLAAVVLAAAAGLVSCSDSTEPQTPGTLTLNLVDAPAKDAGFESLVVVFSEVLVHQANDAEPEEGEWVTVLSDTIPAADRTFDLLELVDGVWAPLGQVDLEPDVYTQIRIMLEDVVLTVDGAEQDLFIPSGDQTGIKLTGEFRVDPGEITSLTVDFDVARSLYQSPPGSGNYKLKPTIRLVETVLSGTVSGTVLPTGIGATVYALEPAGGDTVTSTQVNPDTGHYVLQALLEGVYDISAAAEGHVGAAVAGVAVTAGLDTPDVDFELEPVIP